LRGGLLEVSKKKQKEIKHCPLPTGGRKRGEEKAAEKVTIRPQNPWREKKRGGNGRKKKNILDTVNPVCW